MVSEDHTMQGHPSDRRWQAAALLFAVVIAGCSASIPAAPPDGEKDDAAATPDTRRWDTAARDLRSVEADAADTAGADGRAPGTPADTGVAPGAAVDARGADVDPPRDPRILPVLIVDVGGKTITKGTKLPGAFRVIEDHDGTLTGVASRPASLETPIGIEHRGAWSLQFAKKSFSLELRDSAGNDRDLPFLGMPAESDWVLRAGYYDHTLLRDALGLWLFREVFGRYAPRSRFVELTLDGKYWGVYLLCEKIKRGKYRVDLPKVAPDAAAGDLTGGYFVHLEAGDFGVGFKTSTGRSWDYGYPRAAEITPPQATYLRDFFDRFERAMAAPDLTHPTNGYPKWIDRPSWVDFALFQELARNTDGYTKSSYYQKLPDAQGGKLIKGPVWDNDLSYGNLNNGTHLAEGWLYEFKWNIPVPWWEKIWRDPPFRNAARCRWQELRKGRLTMAAIDAKIDELAHALSLAQPRENERWKLIGKKESLHAYVGATWTEDIRYLKTWIGRRMAWLDANLGACPP